MEKKYQQRTILQNSSLHLGCTLLADKLNSAGLDQKKVLEKLPKIIDVTWTMASIKELYRMLMKAMYGYESTKELNTVQISDVWEKLTQILMKEWGTDIDVPFPNEEQTKNHLKNNTCEEAVADLWLKLNLNNQNK